MKYSLFVNKSPFAVYNYILVDNIRNKRSPFFGTSSKCSIDKVFLDREELRLQGRYGASLFGTINLHTGDIDFKHFEVINFDNKEQVTQYIAELLMVEELKR